MVGFPALGLFSITVEIGMAGKGWAPVLTIGDVLAASFEIGVVTGSGGVGGFGVTFCCGSGAFAAAGAGAG
ncbi:hypothetical protein QQ056_03005 [Oscillatoria laete-virens NRMC-F 0139]|nr:hypothetical protein [Oscillatoria laete-virens]MDL5052531.1 hypothetical protein [Oscillatoria laete-virens NRMC-F 0139]